MELAIIASVFLTLGFVLGYIVRAQKSSGHTDFYY